MKAREIALLVFILIVGTFIYYGQREGWDLFHIEWDDGFIGTGHEYVYEESQTLEGPFPSGIEVVNSHGEVDIRGVEQDVITLSFRKRIWRRDEDEARQVAERLKPTISRTQGRLRLSTNREEFKKRNFETDFILTVPLRLAADIRNSYGMVKASGLGKTAIVNPHGQVYVFDIEGRLDLDSSYEDAEVADIRSSCRLFVRHADLLVRGVGGDAEIDNNYGRVRLEDISKQVLFRGSHSALSGERLPGPLDIETSYEEVRLTDTGPVTIRAVHSDAVLREIKGAVGVRTTYARVSMENVSGDVTIDGRSVEVSGADIEGKEIRITTSYENVDLLRFSGQTTISLAHGDLTLEPRALNFALSVKNEYSGIRLIWPVGAATPFEARSRGGDVVWNLGDSLASKETNGTSVVKAFTDKAGLPPVILETTYGDIRVEKQGGGD